MTYRNTKWPLPLLLCAAMTLGLCMALAEGEIATWAELQTALNAGGTDTLTEDITATAAGTAAACTTAAP